MANVIITSGELEPTTALYNVPRERWHHLMQKRRDFLNSQLPFDCRALLQFVDEAERMYEPLGFADAEDFIKRGLELDPQQVNWAVEGLRQIKPNEPIPYERAQELGRQYRKLDAATPDLLPAHRPKKEEKPDTTKNDVRVYGNSDSYAIARLRKDRPNIHARVLAGELTANAGMIEAGFRKKLERKKLTTVERIQRRIENLADNEQREIWQWLSNKIRP